MGLTQAQYQSIIRTYERKRIDTHNLLQERQKEIFAKIPEYEELDQAVASAARQSLLQLFEEDQDGANKSKNHLHEYSLQKKNLLIQHGYPADYLDPIYDCPSCQDTGYINGVKCKCFKMQEMDILYEQSHIKDMLATNNFDTLSYAYYRDEDLNRFENAVAVSRQFVEDFKKNYQNLFFYGTVGTGKSFLSGCIAKELLEQGYSVIYFSAGGFFDTVAKYTFDTKQKEYLASFKEDVYNCDLVIIDDLGTEVTNAFVASQLFSLLNERHLAQKATIFSTNLNLEELRDRYSDRVFSRITSHYSLCKLSGPDIRMMKKISGK